MRVSGSLMFCVAMVGASQTAVGQVSNASVDMVVPGVSVALRKHPDYDPVMIDAGSFWLVPEVTVGANYNDNVLANDLEKEGDAFATIRPELVAVSDWSQNSLKLDAYAQKNLYARLTNENMLAFGLSGSARLDISQDSTLSSTFRAQRLPEVLSSLGAYRGAGKPVEYTDLEGNIVYDRHVGDVDVNVDGDVVRYAYTSFSQGGVFFDQRYRNTTSLAGNATVLYQTGPIVSLGFTGGYKYGAYDVHPGSVAFIAATGLDQRYHEYHADGVIRFSPTDLFSGTIKLGYFHRTYDDPNLKNPNGLNALIDLLYNVTPLTSISFHADRSNYEYASLQYVGTTQYTERLQVDHELYRSLLLTVLAQHDHYHSNGPSLPGDEWLGTFSTRYLVNRALTVLGTVGLSQRTSQNIAVVYHAKFANVSVRYAF